MNKLLLYLLFACLAGSTLSAQDAAHLFHSMPDAMLLPIDSMQRLKLTDAYNEGKSAQLINSLNDTTRLLSLSDQYLLLQMGNATIEMGLLPMINDSKVVCLIKTVCAPVCDSRLEFYTVEWKKLDSKLFINLVTDRWFLKDEVDPDDVGFGSIAAVVSIPLMQYNLNPDDFSLSQTYTSPQLLSAENRGKSANYFKDEPRKYTWNKIKFE